MPGFYRDVFASQAVKDQPVYGIKRVAQHSRR
jgi:hypothetical protein